MPDGRSASLPAVLVLEDDAEARDFVAGVVREIGTEVVAVDAIGAARAALADRAWDLLVVDRMLPDGSASTGCGPSAPPATTCRSSS